MEKLVLTANFDSTLTHGQINNYIKKLYSLSRCEQIHNDIKELYPTAEKLCPISVTGKGEGDPFVLYKFIGIVEIGNKIHKDYQEILIKAMSSG